jgi:hypothetical protein
VADVDRVVDPARAARGLSSRLAVGSAVGVRLGVHQEVDVPGRGLLGLETGEVALQRSHERRALGVDDIRRVEAGAVEVEDAGGLGADKDNLGDLRCRCPDIHGAGSQVQDVPHAGGLAGGPRVVGRREEGEFLEAIGLATPIPSVTTQLHVINPCTYTSGIGEGARVAVGSQHGLRGDGADVGQACKSRPRPRSRRPLHDVVQLANSSTSSPGFNKEQEVFSAGVSDTKGGEGG